MSTSHVHQILIENAVGEGKMGMESPSEESRSSIPSLPEDVIREDMLLAMMTPMEEAVSGLGGLSIQEPLNSAFKL
ncbi:hypothetical protein PROFUN_11909 [Planoprotostelium fungivorum]|uniref:Uncharacterized protein n=1 Tax=Planoprotostelium fungivorum TaxID=1890364 RepID=A0A2P6N924_9EUKA|nr:hypothetical protein PROFUN_11909 [Planoprotostelium fungivorum]